MHKIPLSEDIYNKLPNGGAVTLNVFSPEQSKTPTDPIPPPPPNPVDPIPPPPPILMPVPEPIPEPFPEPMPVPVDIPMPPRPPPYIEPVPVEVKDKLPEINMEKLIFLKPKTKVPFIIQTDKDEYQPGDKVQLDVQLGETSADSEEKFYASITVTDVSSFLEVPKEKHMPSLPAMVYLEKEVKQMNGEVDEF